MPGTYIGILFCTLVLNTIYVGEKDIWSLGDIETLEKSAECFNPVLYYYKEYKLLNAMININVCQTPISFKFCGSNF